MDGNPSATIISFDALRSTCRQKYYVLTYLICILYIFEKKMFLLILQRGNADSILGPLPIGSGIWVFLHL